MAREMTILTKEQYEEAKEKVKQIENFINTEIIPYVNDSILIPVGQVKEKNVKPHFTLFVDGRGVSDTILGSSGHLNIYFVKENIPSESGRGVYIYDSWNYGGEFCYELIKDWSNVKRKLLDFKEKRSRQASERKTIFDNFEL